MSVSPLEYVRHMVDEAAYITQRMEGVSQHEFLADATLKRAMVRSLEVIGEASKKVPAEYRQCHPDIDWRAIAGMRDRLIHDYLGVDYDIVWDAIVNKAPVLRAQLEKMLEDEVH